MTRSITPVCRPDAVAGSKRKGIQMLIGPINVEELIDPWFQWRLLLFQYVLPAAALAVIVMVIAFDRGGRNKPPTHS